MRIAEKEKRNRKLEKSIRDEIIKSTPFLFDDEKLMNGNMEGIKMLFN